MTVYRKPPRGQIRAAGNADTVKEAIGGLKPKMRLPIMLK